MKAEGETKMCGSDLVGDVATGPSAQSPIESPQVDNTDCHHDIISPAPPDLEDLNKSTSLSTPQVTKHFSADKSAPRTSATDDASNMSKKKSPGKQSKSKSDSTGKDGVVFGNFHASESDDPSEVLLPRLVNGCNRVLLMSEKPQLKKLNYREISKVQCIPHGYIISEEDSSCGVAGLCGCCQPLATRMSFLTIFCLTTVFQGMFYTYFASGLSTIQKLYRISSQMTGIIMSATELGQICGSLFLAYYGNSGHRPRWISCGVLLFAFCTFLCALPHFMFDVENASEILELTMNQSGLEGFNICDEHIPDKTKNPNIFVEYFNHSLDNMVQFSNQPCEDPSRYTNIVLGLFFVALIGVGIGQTAVANLGIPYIDDNVDNKNSPMYLTTTSAVRILGPTLGFVLGSMCTRLYVYPLQAPSFGTSDTRWIGAWWLGHIFVATLLLIVSALMFLFPRRLPAPHSSQSRTRQSLTLPLTDTSPSFAASNTFSSTMSSQEPSSGFDGKVRTNLSALLHPDSAASSSPPSVFDDNEAADDAVVEVIKVAKPGYDLQHPGSVFAEEPSIGISKPKLKDFPGAVRRQLRNTVLVLRTASCVLHILPIAGLYTFLPKYLETQFRLPVHTAAMLSGTGGILLMGVGILLGGIYIRYVRPSARTMAAWIALTALVYSFGMVVLMFIGCEQEDFRHLTQSDDSLRPVFSPLCNRTCSCDDTQFSPVCTASGETHFSACHIGCSTVNATRSYDSQVDTVLFSSCECLEGGETAELGFCDIDCNALVWYIAIFAILVIIYSTAEVGGMLITLRCCHRADKAMALGLISLAVGLFGNVPCPIIYGGLVDAACIQWRRTCGTTGDCQLYDTRFFRYVFHGITAGLMLVAFFVDVAVWVKSKNIILQPDSVDDHLNFSTIPPDDFLCVSSSVPYRLPCSTNTGDVHAESSNLQHAGSQTNNSESQSPEKSVKQCNVSKRRRENTRDKSCSDISTVERPPTRSTNRGKFNSNLYRKALDERQKKMISDHGEIVQHHTAVESEVPLCHNKEADALESSLAMEDFADSEVGSDNNKSENKDPVPIASSSCTEKARMYKSTAL